MRPKPRPKHIRPLHLKPAANKKNHTQRPPQHSPRHAGAVKKTIPTVAPDHQALPQTLLKSATQSRDNLRPDLALRWNLDKFIEYNAENAPANLSSFLVPIGSVRRIQTINTIKYAMTYNTMDMITIVFKLYDGMARKETNYGMIFCEVHDIIPQTLKERISACCISNNVAFQYYSASASYVSCDGEYRSQFTRFVNLCHITQQFSSLFDDVTEYIKQARPKRFWSVYTSYFYPKLEQELRNNEVEFAVRDLLLPHIILSISWFLTIYEELLGITKTHINPQYKEIMLSNAEADVAYLKQLIDKYGATHVEKFHNMLYYNMSNPTIAPSQIALGFKMIPLNIRDVQEPIVMRYKQPWREFYITQRAADFVLCGISPSFPIMGDWFYIKNSRKGLYDNASMYERMHNSELVKDILHTLYEAQRGTYFVTENLGTVEKTDAQIRKYISAKFKKLHDKIDEPINYALEDIIMSEVTLAYTSEYVGRTFADTVAMIGSSALYSEMVGHPLQDSGHAYFAKYMFEICYALLCMNTKLGVIHGDLHLNNATIGKLYTAQSIPEGKKTLSAYQIGKQVWIFPNNGVAAQLIDFSRALLNPTMAENIIDAGLPSNYKLLDSEERMRLTETTNLLNIYIQMFPSKLRHREELIVIFKNYYQVAFRLLCCIDVYLFTVKLQRLLRDKQYVGKKATDLVDRIHRQAEQFITVQMNNLIENPAANKRAIEQQDWPMHQLLVACFAEYSVGAADDKAIQQRCSGGQIIDYFCYENPLRYSATAYDTFHPLMKMVANSDTDHIVERENTRREYRHAYEKQKLKNLAMMEYIAMRHKQKLA